MDYLVLIYSDHSEAPDVQPGTPGFDAMMASWDAYDNQLRDAGVFLAGAGLAPTETATTVRKSDKGFEIVDGPFAETKEQLGGYYLIRTDDLDDAIEWAKKIPVPEDASLEIRPVIVYSGEAAATSAS